MRNGDLEQQQFEAKIVQSIIYKFTKLSLFSQFFNFLLAGNKRPRGPKQLSKESTELRDFLEKLGLDVEEFDGMRSAELETTSSGAQQQQGFKSI